MKSSRKKRGDKVNKEIKAELNKQIVGGREKKNVYENLITLLACVSVGGSMTASFVLSVFKADQLESFRSHGDVNEPIKDVHDINKKRALNFYFMNLFKI